MLIGLDVTIRNAHLNAIRDRIDAGPAAGKLKFYTGPRPATGGAPTGATLLGTCTFSDPSAPAAAAGQLTFNAIAQDDAADASGTAAWARAESSAAQFAADFDVTDTLGDGAIKLNTTDIVADGPIVVNSAVLTAGDA